MSTDAQSIDPQSKKWLDAIVVYERDFQKWERRAEQIVKRYRDYDNAQDTRTAQSATFNILWSNVQVLLPSVFSRLPKPDVSRRFKDADPIGRVAALLLERGLSFELDHYPDYRSTMRNAVLDRFLGGRGTAWVRYEPHIQQVPGMPEDELKEDGPQITDDADAGAEIDEEIEYECCPTDYVHWRDFGHTIARTWEEVTAVWRRVYMNKDDLKERFPDSWEKIPLDVRQKNDGTVMKVNDGSGDDTYQACIYEIWDKSKGVVYWFNRQQGIIDQMEDPLGLENFFPCPRPLYSTITTDSLIPVPDFKIYQDQAMQLNVLAARIEGLITMLQVKGVYDASVPELARLFKEANNGDLIAVKNFVQFAEKSGLKGTIDIFDITPIVSALNEAYTAVEAVKNEIYELMGISDIVRGASDPTETYGAQKLKGQYGSMRLRAKQEDVMLFATELLQIKAQIICKHFQPQTLLRIGGASQLSQTDQQLLPQAIQLLMGDRANNPESDTKYGPLAEFRIEVTSDSMVQMDEQQEKMDRMEFLKGVGGFLEQIMPAVEKAPQSAPLLVSLLKFGITGFRVGKTIEGILDQSLDQLTQAAAQPQSPKPDPEMAKVQAESQANQQEMQLKAQLDQNHLNMQMQLEKAKQTFQAQETQQQNALEAQRAQLETKMNAQLEAMKQANAKEIAGMQGQIQMLIAAMNNKAKIDVAEIAAASTINAQQISASNQAVQ